MGSLVQVGNGIEPDTVGRQFSLSEGGLDTVGRQFEPYWWRPCGVTWDVMDLIPEQSW